LVVVGLLTFNARLGAFQAVDVWVGEQFLYASIV
jgi:hypothetical protein